MPPRIASRASASSSPCRRSASVSSPTSAGRSSCRGLPHGRRLSRADRASGQRGRRARAWACRCVRAERAVRRPGRRPWKATRRSDDRPRAIRRAGAALGADGRGRAAIEACFCARRAARRFSRPCSRRARRGSPSPRRRARRCGRSRRPARRSPCGRWRSACARFPRGHAASSTASFRGSAADMISTKAFARLIVDKDNRPLVASRRPTHGGDRRLFRAARRRRN